VLAAAKDLFAEFGYEATTTAAIARRAHTSQSQLLKHFRDKLGLLQEVLNEGLRPLNSAIHLAIPGIAKPQEQLALIIDMLLSFIESNEVFSRVLLREADRVGETNPAIAEFNTILKQIFEQLLVGAELAPNVSPDALRIGLMGALKDMLRNRAFHQGENKVISHFEIRLTFSKFLSSCLRSSQPLALALPSTMPSQIDEDPWLNHYLELADLVLQMPPKPGQA
jgi:AcrR family transcriptional regulator